MLKDIEIKRINLGELPTMLFCKLAYKYHVEQWDFVVMFDDKEQIMYVNREVSDGSVQKFLKIASWPKPGINDPDCPIADIADYVYKTYGWKTWNILIDAYASRQQMMKNERTQARLREILPLIRGEMDSVIDGDIPDPFDERLVACVSDAGREADRGRNMHWHAVGSGTKYVFYLGYLMGLGKIKEETEV